MLDRIRDYQGEGQQLEMFEKENPTKPSFFWRNLPYIVVVIFILALFATA